MRNRERLNSGERIWSYRHDASFIWPQMRDENQNGMAGEASILSFVGRNVFILSENKPLCKQGAEQHH